MQLTFREIILADARALAALSHQFGYSVTVEEMRDRMEQMLSREDHCGFVAIAEQQIVGWIHGFYTFRLESEPFVEIGGLVIDEGFRRQGIGQQLIARVKVWASGFAVQKIRVRCNTIRTDAHKFYLKVGFTESKEQKIFDLIF
ncbi:GNAT family N-acetyltransferase [Pontibacter sp. HSC-36F09]|uniref:GNAT family N-acetyltransferase n=1 Tax=Pontibacter sp. HSC-36F09 TaxID=2910966 RepID=UPI0020A225A2|nr:GNAT family N-acetyltransferase [Pontibacter sp. HSC-36F09]MCP2043469.1 GNAT superfamily N-acetyltransferase [Pontibacter sp. HSC-36F09]